MKKMSLKIAQASLSRDEMRMITGGSGGEGCSQTRCSADVRCCPSEWCGADGWCTRN